MKSKFKNVILGFLLIVAFAVSAVSTYYFLDLKHIFVKPNIGAEVVERKKIEIDEKSLYNVLLLGYGGEGHDGGMLSDTIIVANIDTKNKRVNLISVPRDLWVSIPIRSDISEYYKINAAYAIGSDDKNYGLKQPQYTGPAGGGEMAKRVVGDVTDLPIDYFVSVSFDGFSQAVDILGGVDVDVPVTFDDYFYPVKGLENETCGFSGEEIAEFHAKYSGFDLEKQFTCRYEQLHFDQGVTLMDGATVLKFVRSRHSSQHGGDFARSQRQQAVLRAIADKVASSGQLDDSLAFFAKFDDVIRTDIDNTLVENALEKVGDPNGYSINFISLNEDNVLVSSRSSTGAFILVPKAGIANYEDLRSFIKEEISLSS
jgi:anionic cell wall polymer biosynthesis LytR-Cps2A-Psr (LCP) family protein